MSVLGSSSSRLRDWEWAFIVVLILLAWVLRLGFLDDVPPGWRDDELINIHALSNQLLEGRFPLYYLGASGHEPLYHHLHAGIHAALGFNVLSGHVLSVAFGLLSIALTFTLARRLFPAEPAIAAIAALALAMSFWSLMYSRMAIRHISLLPLALGTLYAFWRQIDAPRSRFWRWGLTGFLLGVTLYTYTAARLLPALLAVFAAYLALAHRDLFQEHWRGMVVALAVMSLLAAPLGAAIAEGRSKRAIEGIGADARVAELAQPLRELRDGNPGPLLRNTWTTLGMFHATGDPEWLYNIAGRPVFNLLGGILLWGGVGLSLYHWRQPRYFFLLLWLGLGLLPAFVSTPAASLGHTIVAQPVAYLLPTAFIVQAHGHVGRLLNDRAVAQRPCRRRNDVVQEPTRQVSQHQTCLVVHLMPIVGCLLVVVFLATNGVRDLRDYFLVWPQRGMVRLLYRSDYREAAQCLDAHSELTDLALSSALMGPWDRLSLAMDVRREGVAVRLFNPERALIAVTGESASPVALTSWPDPAPLIMRILESGGSSEALSDNLRVYRSLRPDNWLALTCGSPPTIENVAFGNGLLLTSVCWSGAEGPGPGQEGVVVTIWHVVAPLDLPPMPVVANPPPPGVYSGPRLAVFAHLLDERGVALATDDGLWVDPLTLRTGDRFMQLHRFRLASDAPEGPYTVELGLYDPKTGDRLKIINRDEQPHGDRFLLPSPENRFQSCKGGRFAQWPRGARVFG